MAIAGQLQFGGRLCEAIGWKILFVVAHQYSALYSFERQTKGVLELTIIVVLIVMNCLQNKSSPLNFKL
jgi:hypothetical protein